MKNYHWANLYQIFRFFSQNKHPHLTERSFSKCITEYLFYFFFRLSRRKCRVFRYLSEVGNLVVFKINLGTPDIWELCIKPRFWDWWFLLFFSLWNNRCILEKWFSEWNCWDGKLRCIEPTFWEFRRNWPYGKCSNCTQLSQVHCLPK